MITPTNNRQRSSFPPLNSLQSDSGIGNETPNSPREKSLTVNEEREEDRSDMSGGGERK